MLMLLSNNTTCLFFTFLCPNLRQCLRASLTRADPPTAKLLLSGAQAAGVDLGTISPYPALFRRLGLPILSPTFSVPDVSDR